ncbi:hypothetical protein GCM10010193_63080 [Kitasatospora atroaurantiaca]
MAAPPRTTAGDRIDESLVQDFEAELRGELSRPGDPGYAGARQIYNGMIDRRPALIARCTGAGDTLDAVRFARANEPLVAARWRWPQCRGQCAVRRRVSSSTSLR